MASESSYFQEQRNISLQTVFQIFLSQTVVNGFILSVFGLWGHGLGETPSEYYVQSIGRDNAQDTHTLLL